MKNLSAFSFRHLAQPYNSSAINLVPAAITLATIFFATNLNGAAEVVQVSGEDVERGQDFAVRRIVVPHTNEVGQVTQRTNNFKVLENNLHYLDAGVWKISEDLIESFPGGAVATRGPNKAIFSSDAGDAGVFDILTSAQERIRGGVRAIQLTDLASGRSVVLATIKKNGTAPGQLLPPNQVLYLDCFDGLRADLVLIWKHNVFCHEVVLRQKVRLPDGMAAASTRLEIVTEFIESPEPTLNKQVLRENGMPELEDHAVISFGQLALVHGKAFSVAGEKMLDANAWSWDDHGSPVLKQWQESPDGRKFLVESISWTVAVASMNDLPLAAALNGAPAGKSTASRVWPAATTPVAKREPLLVARAPYRANGFVVDFVTLPDNPLTTTFLSGETYYIPSSYYTGSAVTFQPGCTVKYLNNAYMLLYGSVSFPPAGQLMPVFTSRDDNTVGFPHPDSDGNPADQRAAKAIWIYYVTFDTTIRNVRIRWAQTGIRYDANPGVYANHYVNDSLFQECTTGIYSDIQGGTLYLSNVKQCNVSTTVSQASGSLSGSMTQDCGPFFVTGSFAGIKEQEDEYSVPDTMGCVGPNHFVEMLNGSASVTVLSKYTGQRLAPLTGLASFFALTIQSGTYAGPYPVGNTADPRILFDHQSQRWIACAMDNGSGHVLLAVSKTADPVGSGGTSWVADNWTKYLVPLGPSSRQTDFPTLGIDSNGIYIAVDYFNSGDDLQGIAAIPKGPLVGTNGPSQPPVQGEGNIFRFTSANVRTVQPAVNFDAIAADGAAWFVVRNHNTGGEISYARLQWTSASTATSVDNLNNWNMLPSLGKSFYNLNSNIIAPQAGGSGGIKVLDSRLMMALVRDGNLWTCQHIGVNASGEFNGEPVASLRSAVQWYRIQTTPSVCVSQYGRIYDGESTPWHYYYPSLMVNKGGKLLFGFSGSRSDSFVSGFYLGRSIGSTDCSSPYVASPGTPVKFFNGVDYFEPAAGQSWAPFGDYSFTSLDPDGNTFWTIQEYAEQRYTTTFKPVAWGTRFVAISPF